MDNIPSLNQTLLDMGINPNNFGKMASALPPIPGSDPMSLQKNRFDGFYKYGAKEFWGQSEMSSNEVQEFQKCQHYLIKEKAEIKCHKCHVGWVVGDAFRTQDGKLYNNDQELIFAV